MRSLINKITQRILSEALDTSNMPPHIHDVYIASSDVIDAQLNKLTAIVERLSTEIGSPRIATNIVKALASGATHANIALGPEALQFKMSSRASSEFDLLDQQMKDELYDDIDDIVATLSSIITKSPTNRSIDILTIIAGHLDDYMLGHGG